MIGGVLGAYWSPPRALVATALAFASGSLIAALAIELFGEAFRFGGVWPSAMGFIAGSATFTIADSLLDRSMSREGGGAAGFALLAAVTLDGAPENVALGISLLHEGGSIALLVAIFSSNLPEALAGAVSMHDQGRSRTFAIVTWTITAVVLAAAVLLGNTLLAGLDETTQSVLLAFAGGAVLASLADTLMPQAYEEGGPFVAFATTAGFLVSFLLSKI